jgi:TRAP-type C4-dicarboxylate transport system permease small subunit
VRFLEQLSNAINHWIEYLLFGLGITMALIVATQVFFRYVLNQSLFWSEELARFLLVWLTFLGATVAYRRKAHPGIDVLYSRMSPALQKAAVILTHLAAITLFAVMVFYGYQFAYFIRLQISPALYLPKWIILSIIPLSGLILLVHAGAFLLKELMRGDRDD